MSQQWECEPQSLSYDLCTALPLWRGDTWAKTKKPPKADLFPTDQHLVEFHPVSSQVQGKHYIHPGHWKHVWVTARTAIIRIIQMRGTSPVDWQRHTAEVPGQFQVSYFVPKCYLGDPMSTVILVYNGYLCTSNTWYVSEFKPSKRIVSFVCAIRSNLPGEKEQRKWVKT